MLRHTCRYRYIQFAEQRHLGASDIRQRHNLVQVRQQLEPRPRPHGRPRPPPRLGPPGAGESGPAVQVRRQPLRGLVHLVRPAAAQILHRRAALLLLHQNLPGRRAVGHLRADASSGLRRVRQCAGGVAGAGLHLASEGLSVPRL